MSGETYFDDLSLGQIIRSGSMTIAQEQMIAFARDNDPQFFHVDPDAAKDSMFGGLIGSGWQTAALSMRLLLETARFAGGVVGLGGELHWPRPLRPGDSIRIESEVIELRPPPSRSDRGIVTLRTTTFNQHDEAVQNLTAKVMVFRRPPTCSSP